MYINYKRKCMFATECTFMLCPSLFHALGDDRILKKLEGRRQAAEAREARLKEASSFLDDDGIMEKIFNSLTGIHLYIFKYM